MKRLIISIVFLIFFISNVEAATTKDATINRIIDNIYDIEIKWDNIQFTYEQKEEYIYDETNHEYKLKRENNWLSQTNKIDLINNSYSDVKVNLKYNKINKDEDFKIIFSQNNFLLKQNEKAFVNLDIDGKMEQKPSDFLTVGNVSILLEK